MLKTGNKAVTVGVSDYPAPFHKLPAVAADVREIAKVLQSKNGLFSKSDTVVLADRAATKAAIESALTKAFNAKSNETVFVYLAGHGDVENGEYYYLPCDSDADDFASSAVSLRWIKDRFDKCRSERLFLWLDCCRSGGILKRGPIDDDEAIVARTLKAVGGQGRVIFAACTAEQSAYESPSVGHGYFTDALLRGLKGEAESHGEVTALSLYEFIDRQIGSKRQTPMLFGQLAGRIVLMQTENRIPTKAAPRKTVATKPKASRQSGNWVMLGDNYFNASRVARAADGSFLVSIPSSSADHDATIQSLRPQSKYHHRGSIPFAFGNDADDVEVTEITSESTGGSQMWSVSLKPIESSYSSFSDGSFSVNGEKFTAEDIAEMRAKLILLDERMPEPRGLNSSMVKNAVEKNSKGDPVRCAIREAHKRYADSAMWKVAAKLSAIYALKSTWTVEHILELSIGAASGGKVSIAFRGRRHRRYSNAEPTEISVNGRCSLT